MKKQKAKAAHKLTLKRLEPEVFQVLRLVEAASVLATDDHSANILEDAKDRLQRLHAEVAT